MTGSFVAQLQQLNLVNWCNPLCCILTFSFINCTELKRKVFAIELCNFWARCISRARITFFGALCGHVDRWQVTDKDKCVCSNSLYFKLQEKASASECGFSCLSNTVESRFLEPSVSRTSRYLEPNLVSLGFTSLGLYNFTPDFSNPRFLETHDNSNQFWLLWDKLTLDTLNLWKFPKYLLCMSIKSTLLNKLGTSIICAKVPGTFLKS